MVLSDYFEKIPAKSNERHRRLFFDIALESMKIKKYYSFTQRFSGDEFYVIVITA